MDIAAPVPHLIQVSRPGRQASRIERHAAQQCLGALPQVDHPLQVLHSKHKTLRTCVCDAKYLLSKPLLIVLKAPEEAPEEVSREGMSMRSIKE
jgi:hypothetical protein